ncbi:hypothetical protein EVAR_70165_1 [Eumeta japonica]|uniref:Uncharacterized protein n=1 Tax=Eumeta variegata TaxID=151549 RepID=A0A4C2AG18_EUMVA|nr:hypothetical protein EVAR_70165_1 [Eumeta japonica]
MGRSKEASARRAPAACQVTRVRTGTRRNYRKFAIHEMALGFTGRDVYEVFEAHYAGGRPRPPARAGAISRGSLRYRRTVRRPIMLKDTQIYRELYEIIM